VLEESSSWSRTHPKSVTGQLLHVNFTAPIGSRKLTRSLSAKMRVDSYSAQSTVKAMDFARL